MPDIQEMLQKKTWAVVGASADMNKYGYKVYTCLKKHNYTVYPVNPKLAVLDGDKVFPELAALPLVPEVVNCVVPPNVTAAIVDQCKELGVQYIWMQPGADSEEVFSLAEQYKIHAERACVLVQLGCV